MCSQLAGKRCSGSDHSHLSQPDGVHGPQAAACFKAMVPNALCGFAKASRAAVYLQNPQPLCFLSTSVSALVLVRNLLKRSKIYMLGAVKVAFQAQSLTLALRPGHKLSGVNDTNIWSEGGCRAAVVGQRAT